MEVILDADSHALERFTPSHHTVVVCHAMPLGREPTARAQSCSTALWYDGV